MAHPQHQSRGMKKGLWLVFGLWLLTGVLSVAQQPVAEVPKSAGAQNTEKSVSPAPEQPKEKTILFRRWFVPLDRGIGNWPWPSSDMRYLPYLSITQKEWDELLEKTTRPKENVKAPSITRIVLRGTLKDLQLVDGEGVLECAAEAPDAQTEDISRSFPLEPWGLWTTMAERDGNESAAIIQTTDGSLRLRFPSESLRSEPSVVRFNWSLRSRPEPRSGLLFDFELPSCLSTELHLDLPASLVPTCNVGLITEEPEAGLNEGMRRWRILTGRHSRFSVTISVDGDSRLLQRQAALQQRVSYTIEPEGLNMLTRIILEKADAKVDELILDVESPLRIISAHYGGQSVGWTRLGASENGSGARVHVNLSSVSDQGMDELVIVALAPLPEKRPWTLPRIRVVSQNVFWMETRCGLNVLQPFLVRTIETENAVRVRRLSSTEQPDREVFVFQFFEKDARITMDFEEYTPKVITTGAVQFHWGTNEVRGTMVLDCGIPEGDAYTLQFPISPHWTIDSVKSLHWTSENQKTPAGDEVLSWDVLDDRDFSPSPGVPTRLLSIQLKHPIRPKKSLQITMAARFHPENRTEFRLLDFSPLSLLSGKVAAQHIAVQQSSSQFYLQCRTPESGRHHPGDGLRPVQRYIEDASGNVFALDARGREIRFTLERLKPNYSSQIDGEATVRDKELQLGFNVKCQPIDSSVDRIYVHFAPGLSETGSSTDTPESDKAPTSWTWTGLSEALRPLHVRRLPPGELEELFPAIGGRGLFDDFPFGETWEVRLPVPQSGPFEIRATAVRPLSDSMVIPLASLPFSSAQRGEIYIKSPRRFPYRVVNTRLKTIPVTSAKWFRYQEIRAAFRYNPREEPRLSLHSPLSLERLAPEDAAPAAWIWSLRLDTQYEPDGIIKNNAVFLLENRGKDKLRIRLPEGIGVEDVQAVWMDDRREIWHPETGNSPNRFYVPSGESGEAESKTPGRTVVVSLPESSRFVTISLEYSSRDKPLVRRRRLMPRYPAADVPILSGSWTSWFPPEFEVSLPSQVTEPDARTSQTPRFSDAMTYLFSHHGFDLFSRSAWNRFWYGDRQRQEAEAGVRVFFDWISVGLLKTEEGADPENDFLRDNSLSRGDRLSGAGDEDGKPSWASLLGDEKLLAEMLGKLPQESGKGIDVKILIDRRALALQGIFPRATVLATESATLRRRSMDIFEQSGLVLLVSIRSRPDKVREYTFRITSPLVLSLHRHFQSESLGPNVRYIPETTGIESTDNDGARETSLSVPLPNLITPQWVPLARWLADPPSLTLPWSISSQIIRLSTVTPDWNAIEMSQGPDNQLFVVHRKTFAAYHWLAFLAVIVLTMRKPFSHPVVLVFLLVLFEIFTRMAAPCQAGVPSGAFLGALVSLGFCLVRPRMPVMSRFKRRAPTNPDASTDTHASIDAAEESSENHDLTEEADSDSSGQGVTLPLGVVIGLFAASLSLGGVLYAEMPVTPLRSVESAVSQGEAPAVVEQPAPRTAPEEAWRVFFPLDENREIVGEVYVPTALLTLLKMKAEIVRREPLHHWSLTRAEYRGAINYNPVSKKLEPDDDFSLTFDVLLESKNAVITLPALPLSPDGATWNSRPIQPIWRTQDNDRSRTLVFHIENEQPGTHQLRLALAPTGVRRENGVARIEMDIPRVADATLFLKTAPETPPIAVAESFGALTPNSATSPEFIARIGPVDKLSFSWSEEADREEATVVEVDQRFVLLVRSTQVEFWGTFAFRVNGGRIRHLNLLVDPRWRLSGQFQCDEHSIETDEKPFYQVGPEGLPSARNEVVQLAFKEPISGPFTLRAGFVLRDSNVVGKVRLPRFEVLNARIVKSVLAVSADARMEINCPETGILNGYRPGWIGIDAQPFAVGNAIPAPPGTVQENDPKETVPLAEYDLTRTDPSWVLGVRTRKPVPNMRLTQTVRFDYGDSSLICRADFVSPGDIFQQRFTVPGFFRIDSVDVRDSQDKPIEFRLGETERHASDSARETGYCIFFRQPLSGRYTITMRGGFATQSDSPDENPSAPIKRRLPMPVFGDVRTDEQALNVFRTASTMVEILVGETGWTASEIAPVLPESFREAFVLGSWKKTAESNGASAPEFTLLPNRPAVQGKQITTLARHTGDSWNLTFDFLWQVIDGELDTVRLSWDEQCAVLAVEPAIPFHLEHDEGRLVLVLTPESPLTGRKHFRIRSALNTSGTSVSIPHIGPDTDKAQHYETKSFLVLPRLDAGGRIPWSLSMLEEPDKETTHELDEILSRSPDGIATETEPVAETSDTPDFSNRLVFQVIDDDFSATISRQNTLSVAELYDISFVVKGDGVVFGIATIDMKSRGKDSVILQMPPGYEPIQITCSGIASKGTRLPPGDRWKIDLWTSDYPQRMVVIFRGSLEMLRDKVPASGPPTLARLNHESLHCGLPFPILEGVSVQKTLWMISFDSVRGQAFVPLDVSTVREKEFGQSSFSSPKILGEEVTELGRHAPSSGPEAMQTLFKLNLLRLYNLRSILELISTPGMSRTEEVRRWFALWSDEWYGINRHLDFIGRQYPEALLPGRHLFLLDLVGTSFEDSGLGTAELYLEAKNIAQPLQALMVGYKELVARNFDLDEVENERRRATGLSADSMLYWRDRLTEDTTYLFGVSRGPIREIRLQSAPQPRHFSERFLESLFPWILLPLLLPFFFRRFPLTEYFYQFPHFWGAAVGVLLWSLFPPGSFGIAVLLLTFLAWIWPVWPKHPEFHENPPG